MSIAMYSSIADAYIDRLKSHFRVSSDEALARRIGTAKSTIATWRRRGSIPEQVYGELFEREQIDFFAVIDQYLGEKLAATEAGHIAVLIMFGRLARELGPEDMVEWATWVGRNRTSLLSRLAKRADHRSLSEGSIPDRLAQILVTVASSAQYGASFLREARSAIDAEQGYQ
jgi:hypothetical protein